MVFRKVHILLFFEFWTVLLFSTVIYCCFFILNHKRVNTYFIWMFCGVISKNQYPQNFVEPELKNQPQRLDWMMNSSALQLMKWWNDEMMNSNWWTQQLCNWWNDEMMKWWNFIDELVRSAIDEMMKWWNFIDEIQLCTFWRAYSKPRWGVSGCKMGNKLIFRMQNGK